MEKALNLLSSHNIPWDFEESEEQLSRKNLIEEFEVKIENQKSEINDKERMIKELQIEYENLLKSSADDHVMLLEKIKINDQLKRKVISQDNLINSLKKLIPEKKPIDIEENHEDEENKDAAAELGNEFEIEVNEENIEAIFGEGEEEFQKISKITEHEIALVQGTLVEKEKLLSRMHDNQKLLQQVIRFI